jgi:hypothetical protein
MTACLLLERLHHPHPGGPNNYFILKPYDYFQVDVIVFPK